MARSFSRMTVSPEERTRNVEAMTRHLTEFAGWFNDALGESGLDIRLDPAPMIASVRALQPMRVKEMVAAFREHGIHREQVQTAAEVIANMIREPGRSGVIIGALQSGKTGSAFATLFAAPMVYLQTGLRFVPLFLTTNQVSHLDQTKRAMRSFFNLYGDIDIRRTGDFDAEAAGTLLDFYAEAGYDFEVDEAPPESVTLRGYSHGMLRDAETDDDVVSAIVDAMTFKRVQGRELTDRIRTHCSRAREDGSAVLLIVDEPQFGASDTFDRDSDELRPCLLSRVFREVDPDFFSPDTPNMMVGLSATPFDTYGLSNLFNVRQRIAPGYVGPNCFAGKPIDPRTEQTLPTVLSFSALSGEKGGPFAGFEEINYLLGHRQSPVDKDFVAWKRDAKGAKRAMSPLERVTEGTRMVRDLLDSAILSRSGRGRPVGGVVRLAQSTSQTEALITNLGLDQPESPYNLIRFYGRNEDAGKVEAVIRRATAGDDRPYLFVVVGKGRMGDAFPASAEVGIDLTQKPADMNALLQGVYGRMCGYGKRAATVVMSDESAEAIEEYVDSFGKTDILKSSRHSLVAKAGSGRRATMGYVRFTTDMIAAEPPGSPLRVARERIEAYLSYLSEPSEGQNVPRRNSGSKFFGIEGLMRDTDLAGYVASNMSRIDPTIRGAPMILEVGRTATRGANGDKVIGYRNDPNDPAKQEVIVTKVSESFRQAMAANNRAADVMGRSFSRAVSQGYSDSTSKAPRGNYDSVAMPVFEVIKVHPNDPSRVVEFHERGRWVFAAMTFHLENEVQRRAIPNLGFLPSATHSARRAMTDTEQAEVLNAIMAKPLGKRTSNREDMAWDAIMSRDAQAVIDAMHDRTTHTWSYDEGTITITDIVTGELDNPNGPAVIELGKPLAVELAYYDQGIEADHGDRSRSARRAPSEAPGYDIDADTEHAAFASPAP